MLRPYQVKIKKPYYCGILLLATIYSTNLFAKDKAEMGDATNKLIQPQQNQNKISSRAQSGPTTDSNQNVLLNSREEANAQISEYLNNNRFKEALMWLNLKNLNLSPSKEPAVLSRFEPDKNTHRLLKYLDDLYRLDYIAAKNPDSTQEIKNDALIRIKTTILYFSKNKIEGLRILTFFRQIQSEIKAESDSRFIKKLLEIALQLDLTSPELRTRTIELAEMLLATDSKLAKEDVIFYEIAAQLYRAATQIGSGLTAQHQLRMISVATDLIVNEHFKSADLHNRLFQTIFALTPIDSSVDIARLNFLVLSAHLRNLETTPPRNKQADYITFRKLIESELHKQTTSADRPDKQFQILSLLDDTISQHAVDADHAEQSTQALFNVIELKPLNLDVATKRMSILAKYLHLGNSQLFDSALVALLNDIPNYHDQLRSLGRLDIGSTNLISELIGETWPTLPLANEKNFRYFNDLKHGGVWLNAAHRESIGNLPIRFPVAVLDLLLLVQPDNQQLLLQRTEIIAKALFSPAQKVRVHASEILTTLLDQQVNKIVELSKAFSTAATPSQKSKSRNLINSLNDHIEIVVRNLQGFENEFFDISVVSPLLDLVEGPYVIKLADKQILGRLLTQLNRSSSPEAKTRVKNLLVRMISEVQLDCTALLKNLREPNSNSK